MTVDVLTHKFDHVFTWFDQGGDGWITRDDFDQMAALFTRVPDEDDHENRAMI
jgi:Ca2+-binding EF-hand superfamily protein